MSYYKNKGVEMGEAKRRGTFEERKAKAILRNKIAFHKRLEEQRRIEAAKPPEQKRREREARIAFTHLSAIATPYMDMHKLLYKGGIL